MFWPVFEAMNWKYNGGYSFRKRAETTPSIGQVVAAVQHFVKNRVQPLLRSKPRRYLACKVLNIQRKSHPKHRAALLLYIRAHAAAVFLSDFFDDGKA